MRLRSTRTVETLPETLPDTPSSIRRGLRHRATPVRTRIYGTPNSPDSPAEHPPPISDDLPMRRRRRAVAQGRQRKRLLQVEENRALRLCPPAPSTMNPATPQNIYSPIVRFLTPSKENVRGPGAHSVLMSPEQGVFGFSSMDLRDEEDEDFSPLTFIKNVPCRSQHSPRQLQDIPPKTRSTPEATLVLDLEETLVYSSLSVIPDAEYSFTTVFQDHQYQVYMVVRPHVKEFLQAVSRNYELFVYTCAKRDYAEKVLDILDPQRKLFRHRLYQEDCSCVLGHYIKDLRVLGRDLRTTVVLDNSPHTYPHHLMNTVPIKSWSGETDDRELLRLIPYMDKLCSAEDVREVLKKRKDHFHRLLSED